MKGILAVVTFHLILMFPKPALAQPATQSEIDRWIGDLDSTGTRKEEAIERIVVRHVLAALPAIEERLLIQDAYFSDLFWKALRLLRSPHLESLGLLYESRLDSLGIPDSLRINRQAEVAVNLIMLGNYSRAGYILAACSDSANTVFLEDLFLVARNVPTFADSAKKMMIAAIHRAATDGYTKTRLLYSLHSLYGDAVLPDILGVFMTDSSDNAQHAAYSILRDARIPGIDLVVRQRMSSLGPKAREFAVNSLVSPQCSPTNLKFLLDLHAEENDSLVLQSIGAAIALLPKVSVLMHSSVAVQLDSLASWLQPMLRLRMDWRGAV